MVGLVTSLGFASFNAVALLLLRGSNQRRDESDSQSSDNEEDLQATDPVDAHLTGIE